MEIITLAKPFVTATVDVLSTMAMVTPKAGKPYVKKDMVAKGDISGIIGLTGDSRGTVSVSFGKDCAVAIVKNMLGGDIQDILADVQDAVGEITNMVSGQARRILSEGGVVLQSGTPSVIMGQSHTISHVSQGPIMAIPFETEFGQFTIEVSLDG